MIFNDDFFYFALVITPMQFFIEPSNINVDPNLFYKSNETPPILHSWKKEVDCFSERPKCNRKGI